MTDIIQKEQEGFELQAALKEIVVTNQSSYDQAIQARKDAKTWLYGVDEFFDPMKRAAYNAHQTIIKQHKTIAEPVEALVRQINTALVRWDDEQERLRREEQQRLEAEARKRAEEQRLKEAEAAQAAGVDKESIDEILDAPIVVEAPVAVSTYVKSSAVNYRNTYSAELVSLKSLVKAAAKNDQLLYLLRLDEPAANKTASAQKEQMNIPGLKLVSNKSAVNGRG